MAFKNCAPFIKFITKIDGTIIDDAKDLDLVMLVYNTIEYSSSFSDTTSSLLQLILMLILVITIILNLGTIKANLSEDSTAQRAPN